MDAESLIIGLLGGSGIGGLLAYWVKSKIDYLRSKHERRYAEKAHEIRKQYELLQEFLGVPWSRLAWLANNLDRRDKDEKQQVASEIVHWLIKNRPFYPGEIQFIFSQVALSSILLATDHEDILRPEVRWAPSIPEKDFDNWGSDLGLLIGEPDFMRRARAELEKYCEDLHAQLQGSA